jgi:hypothetical protein
LGDQGGAAGVGHASVFGCSAIAPADRFDLAGLVWFIDSGDEIVAMSSQTAVIRKRSGATQTFRFPHPVAGERVICAWDLDPETDMQQEP